MKAIELVTSLGTYICVDFSCFGLRNPLPKFVKVFLNLPVYMKLMKYMYENRIYREAYNAIIRKLLLLLFFFLKNSKW